MITIAIAEDHQSLIDGVELLLRFEEEISIVGMANDGEALLNIVKRKQPKVILMDIRMPKIDGITATKIIKKEFPHTKIIAFSMFDQQDAVSQMLKAGASGYLLKNSPLEEVLTAIKEVSKGNNYFDTSIDLSFVTNTESTESKNKKQLLSKSERIILELIGQGKTSSEIGAIRFNSTSTIETHRKNIIRKLGLQGKGELLRYAIEKKYDF